MSATFVTSSHGLLVPQTEKAPPATSVDGAPNVLSQEFPEDLSYVPMGIRSVRNGSDGTPFDGSTPAATPNENGRADPNIITPMSMDMEPYDTQPLINLLRSIF
ncbi:hypothetical protein ACJ73_01034 [Blastomyces percursus]|uniref:Uncharacterized protein n=1 Tax=Blastomyces percursus TaxID=1658174 RepID=A0A1J9QGF8_9EURO|nr:hypothetical protein ACJ73_01034 [Blastomyces percursus]